MHKMFRMKAYEQEYGPHFNEEYARKAVNKMENEDGTRGPHWSIEETTSLANQHGVSLNNKFNRYDWFVALNMIYSDYYRVITNISNSTSPKHYVEFAKAWLNDRDVDEGKMWYYYIYVICDKIREEEMECYEEKMEEDYDSDMIGKSRMNRYRIGSYRRGTGRMSVYDRHRDDYDMDEYNDSNYRDTYTRPTSTRYVRY